MPVDESNTSPRVTIVVTQRDRISSMREALESLYDNTAGAFDLVYVTGRLSGRPRRWLDAEARRRGFIHVEAGRRLTPAEARNIGASRARTEYVQFIENDVIVKAGWLDALVACADETGAEVVVPLTCEGRPLHTVVHHVGAAQSNRETFVTAQDGQRDFHEELVLHRATRQEVEAELVRRRTQTSEVHCTMVRRAFLERIGFFAPDIVSKEYLDFSWAVARAGGEIWVEPAAVVTFLVPSHEDPVRLCDLPYFLLRWSREWQQRSHDALQVKWGLQEEGFIAARRSMADWRIVDHVLKPVLEAAPVLGRRWGFVDRGAKLGYRLLAVAASAIAWRYDVDRRRAMTSGSDARV